jgi:hypothetical protein
MSDDGIVMYTEVGESNWQELTSTLAIQKISIPIMHKRYYPEFMKLIYQRFGYSVDRYTKASDLKRHVHFQTVIEKAICEHRLYLTSEGSVMLSKGHLGAKRVHGGSEIFLSERGVRFVAGKGHQLQQNFLHFWRCAYKQLGIISDLSGCTTFESLESTARMEFQLREINEDKVTAEILQDNAVSSSINHMYFYFSTLLTCHVYQQLKRMEPIYFDEPDSAESSSEDSVTLGSKNSITTASKDEDMD